MEGGVKKRLFDVPKDLLAFFSSPVVTGTNLAKVRSELSALDLSDPEQKAEFERRGGQPMLAFTNVIGRESDSIAKRKRRKSGLGLGNQFKNTFDRNYYGSDKTSLASSVGLTGRRIVNDFMRGLTESEGDIPTGDGSIIAYHSTESVIDIFDHSQSVLKPNSSTRIDGIFFSGTPQHSWGGYTYRVRLETTNPAVYDMRKSRFDSLGIQEAFDAFLRGETSYLIEDMIEYGDMLEEDANKLVDRWENLDLIVLRNTNYAKHTTEFIVPDPYYNGKSAKIINLGLVAG